MNTTNTTPAAEIARLRKIESYRAEDKKSFDLLRDQYAELTNAVGGDGSHRGNIEAIARLRQTAIDLQTDLRRIMLHADKRQASGGDFYDYADSLRNCADIARAALDRLEC